MEQRYECQRTCDGFKCFVKIFFWFFLEIFLKRTVAFTRRLFSFVICKSKDKNFETSYLTLTRNQFSLANKKAVTNTSWLPLFKWNFQNKNQKFPSSCLIQFDAKVIKNQHNHHFPPNESTCRCGNFQISHYTIVNRLQVLRMLCQFDILHILLPHDRVFLMGRQKKKTFLEVIFWMIFCLHEQ